MQTGQQLIGRAAELAALEQAAETTARGRASLVIVEGEAGIGKSALAGWLVARQSARGGRVLIGACSPGTGRDLAFHGWAGVMRGLGKAGAVITGGEARSSRGQVLAAVTEELLRLAGRKGTTVVLEDVHWADASTLDLLDYLVRSARDERLLMLTTVRTADPAYERVKDRLRELGSLPHASVLRPRRLSEAEVGAQIGLLVGAEADEKTIAATFRRTEGVPFLVEELVAAGDAAARDLVGHRLLALGEDARLVVDAVAATVARPSSAPVGGDTVDDELLFGAAALTADRFDAAVTEAVSAGVLRPGSGGRVGFRHALLQEAAAEELPPGRRRELHRRWAEAISASHPHGDGEDGELAAELAEHWAAAGDDERALPAYLDAAAAAGRVFAHRERLRLLLAAAERWPHEPDPRLGTEIDLVAVLADAAELAQMLADFGLARELIDRGRRLVTTQDDAARRAWFDLVELWMRMEERDGVPVAEVRAVVAELRRQPPNRQVVRGLFTLVGALLQHGQVEESERVLEEVWPLVEELDDDVLRHEAAVGRAHTLSAAGRYRDALRWCEKMGALSDRLGDLLLRTTSLEMLGVVLSECGDLPGAVAAADQSKALLGGPRPGPLPENWANVACNCVSGLLDLGGWDEAEERLAEIEAARSMIAPFALEYATWLRWWLDVTRGRPAPSDRFSQPDPMVTTQRIQEAASDVTWAVDMLTHLGQFEQARLVATPLLGREHLRSSIPAFVLQFLAVTSRNEVEAHLSGREADRSIVERIATLVARVPANNSMLRAYSDQAIADVDLVRGAATLEQWRQVADQWSQLGCPYWHAWALLRVAAAATDHDDHETARSELVRAAGIATELRARPLQDRIRQTAAEHGIRLSMRSAPPRTDPSGLTPRELEVLGLLHDGASNRSIAQQLVISEKTVSVHVSNLISKLNSASRGEAVAAARRLGLLDIPEQRDKS